MLLYKFVGRFKFEGILLGRKNVYSFVGHKKVSSEFSSSFFFKLRLSQRSSFFEKKKS